MSTRRFAVALLALAALGPAGCTSEGPLGAHDDALVETPVDTFAAVAQANHPESAGAYGVWYDATHNTFGTPSRSTLAGAPAMRIDDGGFANGVYTIYRAAIPADGTYQISVPVQVVETGATSTNGIRAFQVGVAVGSTARHRGPNPSSLPGLGVSASYTGLTTADDTALGPQTLVTGEFDAHAGDDLLIAFGTDVTSGTWSAGSATWGGHVLVGAITLVAAGPSDGSTIVDDDDGAPDFVQQGAWTVSGGIGHGGGHYRFASSGNATSVATWEATVEPGYYDVQVTYRAGANRATAAHYTIESNGTSVSTSVNQRTRDQQWVYIGGVDASATGVVRVTLSAAQSLPVGSVAIADAVRLVPGTSPGVDEPEMRVAAVTVFDGLSDVGAIQSIIDEIAAHRYNAIAVHTRYRGDATYIPNRADATYPNHEPRSTAVGDVDVLAEFIARGHARGLKIFAYVNTHLVTEGAASPSDPGHVVNAHPEWRTYAYNGGAPVVQTPAHDPEGMWLEPALPDVREYLADVVGDIATNYEIDGVILDRIRYPQTAFTRENRDFGYHPEAIERFNRRFHRRGVPSPRDADWITFRQEAITDTVAAIHRRLERIDGDLILLAYPIGRLTDARQFNYQDWPTWMTEGAIDGVLPQIYTADNAAFATSLAAHAEAYGGDRLLGVTLDAFRAGVDLSGQIETARLAGFAGTSPFRHGTMGDLGYLEQARAAWPGYAEWPAMPWKNARVERLELRGVCADDVTRRRFRVSNPNAWSIPVEWSIVGTTDEGAYFAPPGDSFYEVAADRLLPRVSLLTWRNERRIQLTAAAIALPRRCR
ncbi:family 10 glycosylhydrolase [Sandaracinus amylolyticus]|uniref:family 10 glycosylhydrolase n=1 Tax=Sandaracinus amylolyticus TaxID=927083 RepID=UPI0012EE3AB4|nr:family 10 glycosylhydrolase [Sandaracinus amylolyticus]